MLTDIAEANTQLRQMVQADLPPYLSQTDLEEILARVQRATLWTAETAYVIGDTIIPVTLSGHRYICAIAGTSATTEPTWLKSDNAVIRDGTVTWKEDGPEYDLWDMPVAEHEAWKVKQAKAVVAIGSGDGISDLYQHLKDQVDSSMPIKI